jgi:glycosyltransferase involved in cell wall biosynthesis
MLEIFLTRAPSGESTVWVCPFPLKKEDFSFEPKERVRVREKLGFSQDDFVILYTGRMSLQKNVIAALRAFGHLPENISKRARLVFSGNFDDIGGPFEDCILPRWGMFWALMKEWDCLSLDIMDRVTLLPGMPRDELRGLYSAADVFLSLSLVHDEDYGLAVAEASSSGLPVVLTSWGGYEGFRQMGLEGKWIPVKLAQDGAVFSVSHAAFALQEIAEMQPRSSSSRGAAGAKAADSLSIDAVTKMIESQNVGKSHLIPKFSGFTDIMRELSECVNVRRGSLVFPAPAENSLYERVYRHYVPR